MRKSSLPLHARRLLLACVAAAVTALAASAGTPWVNGDVFVGVGNGSYQVYSNAGVFKQTISDGAGGVTTGGAFAADGRLYATNYSVDRVRVYDGSPPHGILQNINVTLHGGAACESIVFDSGGNFYVGHAFANADVQKYNSGGVFLQAFSVAVENVGSEGIDLSADQTTLFYTSEGRRVMRFDVGGNTQLADFIVLPNDGGQAFSLRLLGPNFDGTNGLIVADRVSIKRLDGTGSVVQTYDAAGEDAWYAMDLDPNEASFWAADFETSNFYRFNIATGAVEVGPVNTGTGTSTVFGLIVRGEITGGTAPQPFCFGDGSSGACPCGNSGLSGKGCANSAQPGGANLSAGGSASLAADTFVLNAVNEAPNSLSFFLQGDVEIAAVRFGDGLRCIAGLRRMFLVKANPLGPQLTSASAPSAQSIPASPITVSGRSAALGDILTPGAVRSYQTPYRDASNGFCPPPVGGNWNITNGLRVTWAP